MAALLAKRKRSRSGFKAAITRNFTSFDTAKSAKPVDFITLKTILDNISDILSKIESKENEIYDLIEDDTECSEFMEECMKYSLDTKVKLKKYTNYYERLLKDTKSVTLPGPSDSDSSLKSDSFKLDRLKVPEFEGDIFLYPAWYDSFLAAVHNNDKLSDIEKFARLRASLKGDAYDCISSFLTNGVNYKAAFDLIQKRFGNETNIQKIYLSAMHNLEFECTDINSIRNFLAKLSSYKRVLETYGKDASSYETILIPILYEKLPESLRLDIVRNNSKFNVFSFSDFCGGLEHIIKILELTSKTELATSVESHSSTFLVSNQYGRNKPSQKSGKPSQNFKGQGSQNFRGQNGTPKPCTFCVTSHDHTIWHCQNYLTPESKYDRVKQLNLCNNCFSNQHRSSQCDSKNSCKVCNKRHHTLLHLDYKASEQDQSWRNRSNNGYQPQQYSNYQPQGQNYQPQGQPQGQTNQSQGQVRNRAPYRPPQARNYNPNYNYHAPLAQSNNHSMPSGNQPSHLNTYCVQAQPEHISTPAAQTAQDSYNPVNQTSLPAVSQPQTVLPPIPHGISATPQELSLNNISLAFNVNLDAGENVLLKTANLTVSSGNALTFCNTLLDDGSQGTLITRKIFEDLNLKVEGRHSCNISGFGSMNADYREFDVTSLYIIFDNGEKFHIRAVVVPHISKPIHLGNRNILKSYPQFNNLKLAHPIDDNEWFDVEFLIGAAYYEEIVSGSKIKTHKLGPVATLSKVGYLISGNMTFPRMFKNSSLFNIILDTELEETDFGNFSSIENLGIECPISPKSQDFLQDYINSIEFKNNRYVAPFPWKEDAPILPSNYNISLNRTRSTIKKLVKLDQLKVYDDIMQDQLAKGFIEKVDSSELNSRSCHYLPHTPVFKDSKTTKCRIVYDCSCKASKQSPSLNDCLLKGPLLLTDLTSILLRFRLGSFVTVSDIEKAFLQISLKESDRDFTRFFWLSDINNPEGPLDVLRFCVVLFGSKPSPFMLGATVYCHCQRNAVEELKDLDKDTYMDNLLSPFFTESEAITFYKLSRPFFKEGGFNLRSFASNSQTINNLASKDGAIDQDLSIVTILGLIWNAYTDNIGFKTIDIDPSSLLTKRYLLSQCSRIFDPLGLLSPVTIRAKRLIQDLFIAKLSWDSLCPEYEERWREIALDIHRASLLVIKRQYFDVNISLPFTLHIFADGSDKCYGVASYLVQNDQSALVMAKAKVKPKRVNTVPKLELLACVIAGKLRIHLEKSFSEGRTSFNCEVHLWSDSRVALQWIFSDKTLNRFENNCVLKILESTKEIEWHYVPSPENPADLTTRGKTTEELSASDLWWYGPDFIRKSKEFWPKWDPKDPSNPPYEVCLITHIAEMPGYVSIHSILDISRFSKLKKLLHTTIIVVRFLKRLPHTNSPFLELLKAQPNISGPYMPSEYEFAKLLWVRSAQMQSLTIEYALLNGDVTGKRTPIMDQLNLEMKDSIIICKGRLHNAPLEDAAKFPILLPKKHYFTKLVVESKHIEIVHKPVADTIAYIRQEFWIPAILQVTKSVVRSCNSCRKVVGKHYPNPIPAPLQSLRVKESIPFSVTGLDYTGAIFIMSPADAKSKIKVYILILTCAVTRCIHLELVQNMDHATFMLAFRRFCARRSIPQFLISDNAPTFGAADKSIKDLFDSPELTQEVSARNCTWIKIPGYAPWFGGFYERLVGMTKRLLRISMNKCLLKYTELETLITEIESVLNDRPLTATSTDISDPNPLTPSQLFQGRRIISCPYPVKDLDDLRDPDYIKKSDLIKCAERRAALYSTFVKRWKNEYLTSLRSFHKSKGSSNVFIKVGDVVQIHDTTPRSMWNLAVVTELVYGKDGIVRSAKLRTKMGNTTRPIVKLYPLEVAN